MGEVYRAHDTKLNRGVAPKLLRPEVATDPDRRTRFRLAKALDSSSSLQTPASSLSSLRRSLPTHGFTPRPFSLDRSARLLVVGNQSTVSVSDGNSTTEGPASLAVLRIGGDGTLKPVSIRCSGVAEGGGPALGDRALVERRHCAPGLLIFRLRGSGTFA